MLFVVDIVTCKRSLGHLVILDLKDFCRYVHLVLLLIAKYALCSGLV